MIASALGRKLGIGEDDLVAIFNAPDRFVEEYLDPLPHGAAVVEGAPERPVDIAYLFVDSKAELEARVDAVASVVRAGGDLWVSVPKIDSGIRTDISTHEGLEPLTARSWTPAGEISVDSTWSAIRLRRAE